MVRTPCRPLRIRTCSYADRWKVEGTLGSILISCWLGDKNVIHTPHSKYPIYQDHLTDPPIYLEYQPVKQ